MVKFTKSRIQKILGLLSSLIVLVFLGEDILDGTGQIVGLFTGAT